MPSQARAVVASLGSPASGGGLRGGVLRGALPMRPQCRPVAAMPGSQPTPDLRQPFAAPDGQSPFADDEHPLL